ncbi:MAG: helix-turn-helix domain-containing protein [Minicystis sp.]
MASRKKAAPPVRRRRDPETARAEILDAAERVLATSPPDAVGLKEVAEAAGVSHALVSHYFGTYTELVESVLMRRIRRLREEAIARLADPATLVDEGAMLDALFASLEDPLYVRLSLWALAAERPSGQAPFPFREQGMRIFAEAATARVLRDRPEMDATALRARVEVALVIANSAAYGYTVGKEAWVAALGRTPTKGFDESVRRALGEMLRGFVIGEGEGSLFNRAARR